MSEFQFDDMPEMELPKPAEFHPDTPETTETIEAADTPGSFDSGTFESFEDGDQDIVPYGNLSKEKLVDLLHQKDQKIMGLELQLEHRPRPKTVVSDNSIVMEIRKRLKGPGVFAVRRMLGDKLFNRINGA